MTTLWHSKSVNDPFNFVSYSNPEFDVLCDQAILETDTLKARELWWKCQEIVVNDHPYTFLFVPKDINWVHKRFKNVKMETVAWNFNIHNWWVPKAEQKYRRKDS